MKCKPIQSFVLRQGRISPRQQQGLDHWLNDYLLPLAPWQYATIFKREAPTIIEIGFGMGKSLVQTASLHPTTNYIGIEVHRAGIGNFAADLHDTALNNVRIAPYDAVTLFQTAIPDASLAGIHIFFPDPWPKKRHHKRRLIQPDFVNLMVRKLQPHGTLHIATDWQAYAEHCLSILAQHPDLKNQSPDNTYVARPDERPLTKFEQRGKTLGHDVFDLMFKT